MKYNVPPPSTPLVDKQGTPTRPWYLFWSKLLDKTGGLLGLPSGHILIGNAVNEPEGQAVTGDITITSGGVTAIGNNKVTNAMLRDSAAVSVIGRSANSSGDPADIAAAANDRVLARTSDTVAFQQLTNGMAADNTFAPAKLAFSATSRVAGRKTASAGAGEELTASELLDFIGSTRGSILYRGALGWAVLAPGTATHVLTSNGAGADPSYQAASSGGGGALVLLETLTASASASLDFASTISATYDDYLIEFINIVPATNGANLYMRMSTNGGSTYDTSTIYGWTNYVHRAGAAATSGAEGGVGFINLSSWNINNGTGLSLSGSIRLFNPGSATYYKRVIGQVTFNDSSFRLGASAQGSYDSATAVNAFRFLMSSGNISSGTIRTYGIAKT